MSGELVKNEIIKKPDEKQEGQRKIVSFELPKDPANESKMIVDRFKAVCAEDLEREGGSKEYKNALQGLNVEAVAAKKEFEAEIAPPSLPDAYYTTPPPLPNGPPPMPNGHKFEPPPLPNQEIGNIPSPPLPDKYFAIPPPLPSETEKWNPDSNFPPPLSDEEYFEPPLFPGKKELPPIPYESAMKDRIVEKAEILSEKEASKKFLAEERKKLALELLEQRKAQRERLVALKATIENVSSNAENLDDEKQDAQYGEIAERQSSEADAMEDWLLSDVDASEQDAQGEKENLAQLISNSEGIEAIKAKLKEHYEKADQLAKKNFESMRKTVEQTVLRNNAFIVHTFLTDERLRHNSNSNISQRATLEDDINILLSLEPSISTSSVMPGTKQGLWGDDMGVVLGGGDVRGAVQTDNGTTTEGIKNRNGTISSSEEIDQKVSDKSDRGYNELVVNNPKVFGFFRNVSVDKNGEIVGFNPRHSSKDNFMQHMNFAKEKGMPLLVMTPDRRLFEFVDITDDGIVSAGEEITPEQVAKGKAGLPNEKRKELGDDVITKNLFRRIADQKEAKGIVAELAGQESAEVDLSREEYLDYVKNETSISLHDFPEKLLNDKEFMIELAQYHHNPGAVYEYAGDSVKRDVNFIRYIYKIYKEKKQNNAFLYASMPEDMKKSEEIALLAIENDDTYNNLDIALAESSIVWEKIIDSLVEKKDSRDWDYLYVGESKEFDTDFTQFLMKKDDKYENMAKKILTDGGFIQKLNNKYSKFKFDVNDQEHITVTRIV